MDTSIFYVDFNEMLERDLVLLSVSDFKNDSHGRVVKLREGLEVTLYEDDVDEWGKPDCLIARGLVERNKTRGWGDHVKWCCRINSDGIRHQSETSIIQKT